MNWEVANMEMTYRQEGDYLIPNLEMDPEPEEALTKYGMLRETYLKENHRGIYAGKLLGGTLTEHCLMIQKQAEERADRLIEQMKKAEGVTEELKEADQMEWVCRMNSIRNRVDEVVLEEIVYSF
jgi:predicted methyltransferase MtxX (methanogen marker protein 4)